jgi:DNA-binding NarL/FixJ family response regulator
MMNLLNVASNVSRNIRVVVVDDREEVRESLETLLSLHKQIEIVGEAQDGPEAVKVARALKPDVIVMDVVMPTANGKTFDGLDACREIKQQGLGAAIIALTVHADRATRARAYEAGCDSFLEKGITTEELVQQVCQLGCNYPLC